MFLGMAIGMDARVWLGWMVLAGGLALARAEGGREVYEGVDAAFLEDVRREFDAAPDSAAATRALAEKLDQKRAEAPDGGAPVLQAYRAALEGIEGKHSRLPWDKYNRAKAGLAQLDAWVEAYPDSNEIRMLRFTFGHQLPEFFGAGKKAAADRKILAERLAEGADPAVAGAYRRDVIQWILRNGDPTPEEKAELESALAGWEP